jgi:hypothetical protein
MKRSNSKQTWQNVAVITLVVLGLMALTEVMSAASLTHHNKGMAGNGLVQPPPPACIILDNANKATLNNNDPLARLLLSGGPCPTNVFEFRARLLGAGAKIKTAFVANRGFHNPAFGSFSMFEMVSGRLAPAGVDVAEGEFFFGHFTARDGNKLFANQDPENDSLMVELIAWDPREADVQVPASATKCEPAAVWRDSPMFGLSYRRWSNHEGTCPPSQRLGHGATPAA